MRRRERKKKKTNKKIMKLIQRQLEPFSGKIPAIILIAIALLRLATPCWADFESSQYGSFKTIEAQTPMKEVIASAQIDSEIYFSTRKNFPGIRIIDHNNAEVSYHIEKAIDTQTRTIEEICRSEIKSLRELPDNKIEIIIQLKYDEPPADGLTLISPQKNFERKVSVFGSENGDYWVEIVAGALVFDYSRYMDVDNRKIELPKNKFRLFRLEVDDVIDEKASPLRRLWLNLNDKAELEHIEQFSVYNRTFRIDRINLWRKNTRQQFKNDVKKKYPVADFSVSENEKEKQTIIELSTLGEPLTAIGIITPDRNFNRRAHIEVKRIQYGNEVWVKIGHATLSKIDFQGYRKNTDFIEFPEHREEVYRLIINNQDNPPLQISELEAMGNVYEILYLNKAENQYRLFYGSETAEEPHYDFAKVLDSMRETMQTSPVSLSMEIKNPEYNAGAGWKGFQILENKWFLILITAALVVGLGWILISTGRKI